MSTTSSPTGGPRRRRIPLRYLLLAVVAVVAVLVAAFGASALGGGGQNLSAKDRIKADPPPTLFSDAAVAPTGREVAAQAARAQRLMQAWWASHGHQRDDAAFTAWAERVLPAPPSAARRTAEVAAVAKIAPARTAAGVQAATWLEAYGKKDLWKLYAHDQAELLPGKTGDARKADVKAMLKLSKSHRRHPRHEVPAVRAVRPAAVAAPGPHRHQGAGLPLLLPLAARRRRGRRLDLPRRPGPAPGRGLRLDPGRDRLLPRLHGRPRAERHRGRSPARRPDRRVLPGQPGLRPQPGVSTPSSTSRRKRYGANVRA